MEFFLNVVQSDVPYASVTHGQRELNSDGIAHIEEMKRDMFERYISDVRVVKIFSSADTVRFYHIAGDRPTRILIRSSVTSSCKRSRFIEF
jgi:hypothetical protein